MRAILPLLCVSILLAGQAPPAADAPPSVDETVVLDLLNQFRTDPRSNHLWVDGALRRAEIPTDRSTTIFWGRQKLDLRVQRQPLVFNPQLMQAARAVLAAKPRPERLKPVDALAPIKAAGYSPDAKGLALTGPDADALHLALAVALVHVVAEDASNPKYIVPKFGLAEALLPEWREAGVAVAVSGKKYSVAIVLGQGSAKRYLGGLAYADANRNGRYDAGEGKAGVTAKIGAASVTTGPGGAWWLAQAGDDAVDVTFTGDGFTAVRAAPKAAANAQIDWRLPNAADLKAADKLIEAAEKDFKADDEGRRKAQAALLAGTRRAVLDDARTAKVATLVESIKEEYDEMMKRLLGGMSGTPDEFKSALDAAKKRWKGSFAPLFKEVEALYKLREGVNKAQTAPADQHAKLVPPLLQQIEKAMPVSCEPVLVDQLLLWREALQVLVANAEADPKKK